VRNLYMCAVRFKKCVVQILLT